MPDEKTVGRIDWVASQESLDKMRDDISKTVDDAINDPDRKFDLDYVLDSIRKVQDKITKESMNTIKKITDEAKKSSSVATSEITKSTSPILEALSQFKGGGMFGKALSGGAKGILNASKLTDKLGKMRDDISKTVDDAINDPDRKFDLDYVLDSIRKVQDKITKESMNTIKKITDEAKKSSSVATSEITKSTSPILEALSQFKGGGMFGKALSGGAKGILNASKLTDKLGKSNGKLMGALGKSSSKIGGIFKMMGAAGGGALKSMAGIAGKMNPYVAALQVAAAAVKVMAQQFQRIVKDSAKFVAQGSLFTDQSTMAMMQKTGQTATQAQGTQRSLDMLGLDFSNLQEGRLTGEQAEAFEQLRARELAKLEEMSEVAGPMMKSMQQVTLGISLLMQDINDWITLALGRSAGWEQMIGSIKGFISTSAVFIKGLIDSLTPVFGVVGSIVGFVLDIISAIMDAINPIWEGLAPIMEAIDQIVAVIKQVLSPAIMAIGFVIKVVIKIIMVAMEPLLIAVRLLSKALGWLQEKVIQPFTDFIVKMIESIGTFINGAIGALRNFKVFGKQPFKNIKDLDFGTSSTAAQNAGSTYENQTTNNYIYGSQDMNSSSYGSNSDLFSNSYVLVND